MISKAYSINVSGFNNNARKIGENYKTNKDEDKKDRNGNINIQGSEQRKKRNQVIENLERIKQSYLEQKRELTDKTMDPKEKRYKVEELDKNIQTIEAQIQQFNIQQKEEEQEKMQAEIEKKKAEEYKYKNDADEKRGDIIIADSLKELIKLSSAKKNIHALKDIKNKEKREAAYIRPDDNPKKYNYRRLAQIHKSAVAIDARIASEVRGINQSAKSMGEKVKLAVDKKEIREDDEEKKESIEEKRKLR